MNVAVIGGDGQLGNDVVRTFLSNGDEVRVFTHSDIELANKDSVSSRLQELRPQLVVNAAAMHHVENCEREPEKGFCSQRSRRKKSISRRSRNRGLRDETPGNHAVGVGGRCQR
jgi:dTDP-4-dehydrorhamnose reductase